MTTIDQRILILAAPNIVWEKLSDLSNNVNWQADYQDMAFLSANHQGTHTRWRYRSTDRREYILEITAWYDGLGYEYTIVEGGQYRENRGRIRLQETPEGTVVQWTFSYELGGFLGGMRNALGLKRRLETLMVDSLKTLWQQVKDNAPARYESKALIREALDYDERSRYKPRHASQKDDDDASVVAAEAATPIHIEEPPVAEDDTRPRPAVSVTETVAAEPEASPFARPVTEGEPDFLKFAAEDTEPRPLFRETFESKADDSPVETAADVIEPVRDARLTETDSHALFRPVEPVETPKVAPEPEPEAVTPEPESVISPVVESPVEPAKPILTPEEAAPSEPVVAPKPADNVDTSTASIWEIFGIPRPSETQETPAVRSVDEAVKAVDEPVVVLEPEPVVIADEPAQAVADVPVSLEPVAETAMDMPVVAEADAVSTPVEEAVQIVPDAVVAPEQVVADGADVNEQVAVVGVDVSPVDKRVGLRVQLRRKQVRLRR